MNGGDLCKEPDGHSSSIQQSLKLLRWQDYFVLGNDFLICLVLSYTVQSLFISLLNAARCVRSVHLHSSADKLVSPVREVLPHLSLFSALWTCSTSSSQSFSSPTKKLLQHVFNLCVIFCQTICSVLPETWETAVSVNSWWMLLIIGWWNPQRTYETLAILRSTYCTTNAHHAYYIFATCALWQKCPNGVWLQKKIPTVQLTYWLLMLYPIMQQSEKWREQNTEVLHDIFIFFNQ